ncbi:hypothetical protein [Streptomyces sp. NPDC047525]|uniref:hypothetical protein n=1 Tax=Streptomyces sp. NPDC047525 TaxID=3155264 RepID=UPI0033E328B2
MYAHHSLFRSVRDRSSLARLGAVALLTAAASMAAVAAVAPVSAHTASQQVASGPGNNNGWD